MSDGFSIEFSWNEAEFRRLLETETVPEAVWGAARRTRDRAKANLTAKGRVNDGTLRNSIVGRRVSGTGRGTVWYEVGSELSYAIYQEKGVEGPVLPRRARVLRFKPSGSSTYVFARRTSGFEGANYLTDALRSLSIVDFTR